MTTTTTTATPEATRSDEIRPGRRIGDPVRVLQTELGSVHDGYGNSRLWMLVTPDDIKAVLNPEYWAAPCARDLKSGDWILCTASCDQPVNEPAILFVARADRTRREEKFHLPAHRVQIVPLAHLPVPVAGKSGAGKSAGKAARKDAA